MKEIEDIQAIYNTDKARAFFQFEKLMKKSKAQSFCFDMCFQMGYEKSVFFDFKMDFFLKEKVFLHKDKCLFSTFVVSCFKNYLKDLKRLEKEPKHEELKDVHFTKEEELTQQEIDEFLKRKITEFSKSRQQQTIEIIELKFLEGKRNIEIMKELNMQKHQVKEAIFNFRNYKKKDVLKFIEK